MKEFLENSKGEIPHENISWFDRGHLHDVTNPTSIMEIHYEESLVKLMGNYHRLSVEEIELINKIAKRL